VRARARAYKNFQNLLNEIQMRASERERERKRERERLIYSII